MVLWDRVAAPVKNLKGHSCNASAFYIDSRAEILNFANKYDVKLTFILVKELNVKSIKFAVFFGNR